MNLWKMFREMENLQNQLFDLQKEFGPGRLPISAFNPGFSQKMFPLMNISTDENSVFIEAVVPGADPSSLKVSVARNNLTISGEKCKLKIPDENFHRSERGCGKFVRTIELPVDIDQERISAEYKNGILYLSLPKAEEAKPRQIQIKI